MDAEGLGCKLLLTPPATPAEPHEKQTMGTVTASHKMLTLQALSSSLNVGIPKRGCLGRGKAFGRPPAVCPTKRPRSFTHYRWFDQILRIIITKLWVSVSSACSWATRSALKTWWFDPEVPCHTHKQLQGALLQKHAWGFLFLLDSSWKPGICQIFLSSVSILSILNAKREPPILAKFS